MSTQTELLALPRTQNLLRRGIDDGLHLGAQLYVSLNGEVAADVGYKDARLFARNFKAAFGKNPVAYRKAHEIWAKTGKAEDPTGPQHPQPVRTKASSNGKLASSQ